MRETFAYVTSLPGYIDDSAYGLANLMNRWIAIIAVTGIVLLLPGDGAARKERSVGSSNVVVKSVTGTLGPDVRKLELNDPVYYDELIETREKSATEITFLDDTKITLGENSQVIVDKFIYDPNQSNSAFVLTLSKGAMRFVSGNMPNEAYQLRTPSGTVGIRGTIVDVVVEESINAAGRLTWRTEVTFQDGLSISFTCDEETSVVDEQGLSTVNQSDGVTCSTPEIGPQTKEARERVQQAILEVLANLSPTGLASGSAVLQTLMDKLERERATTNIVEWLNVGVQENEAQDNETRILSTLPNCAEQVSPNAPCIDF